MLQSYSIKDFRDNLANLVSQVEFGGKQVIITKFGKPKVMVVPYVESNQSRKMGLKTAFGAWKNRKDLSDSAIWISNLRKKAGRQHGTKIFS